MYCSKAYKIMYFLQKEADAFRRHIRNRFIRFICVGGLNTTFGLTVYCLLIWIGLSYIWATLISQVLGVLFNFITTGTLVFENSDKRLIFKFIFCYFITYFINITINKALQVTFGLNEYLSGIFAIIISAIVSFFILRLFVYNEKNTYNEKN